MSRMNLRLSQTALALLLPIMAALAGCTLDPVAEKWVGKDVSAFFAEYGPPMSSGGNGPKRVFVWRNESSWRAITGQIPMLCQTLIYVGAENRIEEFKPFAGEYGRCPEVFGKPRLKPY